MSCAWVVVGALASSILVTDAARAGDPVADRGLLHTQEGRQLAERAIDQVAKLVADDGPRLVPSWRAPGGQASEAVPVYLVEGKPGTIVTPAAVPSGCRCVFVSPSVLKKWIQRNSAGPGRVSLDDGNFLVFILMHEMGHLKKGTPGAAFHDGEMSQLNIEPSRAKAAEEDADDFAVAVLKLRSKQTKANDVSLAANWVVLELTKLNWNMQAFRTLDEFGAFAVGKPSVFFDNGYTHPNLAWRILRVNDRIQQTKETRYLLEAYEQARDRGANLQPLYQRK